MRKIVAASVFFVAASIAYGGFWSTMNKVQKTIDTVNAVGELIDSKPAAQPKQSSAAETPSAAQTVSGVAESAVSAASVASERELAAFSSARTAASDTAVPEIKYGAVCVSKPATPEQVAEAKKAYLSSGRKLSEANVRLEGKSLDDATLAAVAVAFHQASRISIKDEGGRLASVAPVSLFRSATVLSMEHVACGDMKPVATLVNLRSLTMRYCTIDDFAPFASLRSLETLDLYGSKIAGPFSPLAACPKLAKIDYYAVKGDPSLYDSLGDLKQVKTFNGGLSKMTSLSWLRRVPQTEDLLVFAEKLSDLDAVGTLVNLTRFKGWGMDGGSMAPALGDLKFLATCRKLKKLELPGSSYSNTDVIATLGEIEELDLSNAKQPVDVSFAAKLPKLKRISLRGTEVVNGSSIPSGVKVSTDKKTKGL